MVTMRDLAVRLLVTAKCHFLARNRHDKAPAFGAPCLLLPGPKP
jgi:hypothetical protein